MIDTFSLEDFKKALPESKKFPVKYEGLIGGEHCFSLAVDEESKILIRSSIGANGISADCGEDSIRTFLVDNQNRFLGAKISKYTTRVPGWKERMVNNIRFLAQLKLRAGLGAKIMKVKKDGPNKGRFFSQINNQFGQWLT